MNSIKKFALFTLLCLLSLSSLQAEIVTRAAMDVGSAETKLTVADVDTETQKIVHIWYQTVKFVILRKDLAASQDGNLSSAIEERLLNALAELKVEAAQFNPKQWVGVGTSVFRKANNGQAILDRIKNEMNITITLVSQKEEAEIGFNSAVASTGLNPEEILSWDSGSGSFQIAGFNNGSYYMLGEEVFFEVYGKEFAYVAALEELFKLRGQPFSLLTPNPISIGEAFELYMTIRNEKLPPTPNWLQNKRKQVIGIGGITCPFSIGQIATGQYTYNSEQLWGALKTLCGKTDEEFAEFPDPSGVVMSLILLLSVLDHCGFEEITYSPTNGSCEGLLITPQYWQQ